jgi:O-antigen ligase
MSTSTAIKALYSVDTKTLLGLAVAAILGVLVATYPLIGLAALPVCFALYGIHRWCRERLELWQVVVLLAMTPYFILNYGFDNLTLGGAGFQLPVGELLMFFALALVILGKHRGMFRSAMLDSVVICLTSLLLLSCAHLIVDMPRYGLYALRDSSMFVEAVFLILGMVWAQNTSSTQLLMRWLFFVFLVNLFYSYTYSWGDAIRAISPTSGVFHPVPLFGNYQHNALWLLLGAAFFLWLGPSLVRWPRWILVGLAAAQLSGLAILQARSMYVGIALVLLLLAGLGEVKKLLDFASALVWGTGVLAALLLVVSMAGLELQGRVGRVDFSLVADQAKTLLDLGNANARMSHDVDRGEWYEEVWDRVRSNPSNLIVGEGFGQALIRFENLEGIPVRQPHNSSLTVLARLGFVGLSIWLLFIVLVFVRYVRFLRMPEISAGTSSLVVWLLCTLVLSLLYASVQPSLEFSHGASPFFFLSGFGLGIIRWQKREALGLSFAASSKKPSIISAH